MNIFDNLFRGKELENKKAEFERLKDKYVTEGNTISKDSVRLYGSRKDSVRIIQRVKAYVERLDNCPNDLLKGIGKALGYTDKFRETMKWEAEAERYSHFSEVSSQDDASVKVGVGGMVAGTAIATMGSTAAMAIATTFGTASTGVAISSLGGIAATNAALAWLGGGALAAGGAGIAGGSTLLALAGPIGWSIAGVAALGTSMKIRSSNTKAIEEIDKLISELNEKLVIIKPKHERLLRLIDETEKLNNKVDLDRFLNCGNDFESDDYPKDQLVRMIDTCKTMGKLINETIAMQM